jgi:hypothetical protein
VCAWKGQAAVKFDDGDGGLRRLLFGSVSRKPNRNWQWTRGSKMEKREAEREPGY